MILSNIMSSDQTNNSTVSYTLKISYKLSLVCLINYTHKMADRSTHFIDPLDFHSCYPPRGMDYYDLTCLTDLQQKRLNTHKIEVVRDHQKYLYKNPEVLEIILFIKILKVFYRFEQSFRLSLESFY